MFRLRSKPDLWGDKPVQTAVQELEAAAADVYPAMRHERSIDRLEGGSTRIELSDLREVRDRTGAIWHMRKRAMEERDAERVAYLLKFRPIQTLDGLDPHPGRVAMREVTAAFRTLVGMMTNG